MLGLKLNLSHSHHVPCHPTRAHKEYVETQSCITETDRQQFSDEDHYQQIRRAKSNKSQQKKTQNGMSNEMQTIQLQVSKKKKRIQQNLTPQQIYSTNVIEQSLNISTKEVPINIRQMIKQKQKLIEDKVYLGISDKGSDLLERIYQSIDTQTHLKDRIQQNLTNLMDSIQSNLEKDIIDSNKYFIHKIIRSTKEDVIKNTKRKAYDADSLNSKGITFQTSQSGNNKDESQSFASSSHPSQQDFSLKSQHTKKAEQFIKKIQKQQIQQRRKRKQQQERMKSLQVKSMEEKKQFEEQIKTQRKNYLKRRIQAKKQIKQKQLEVREKMNKQYYSFLKKYKKSKPLYKQKQQKYNKFLEEEKIKQLSVLDKIKQQKRSISISQILDHQQKYKNYKKQKSKSKLNELNLESKAQTPMKNYYRAKIFDVLQEEQQQQKQRQIKEHPNFIRSELIKKRDLYARHVREVYLPKGDEAKQNELRELIQKLEWAEKLKSGKLDPKQRNQAGNQYLRRIHELISQLRSKNKLPLISKSIDLDQIEMSTKPQYKNYLQELKLKRRSYSIDYEDLQEFNIQDAQIRAQKYERNAKRRQSYLRGNSFNIDRTLQERKRIDDQYLQSVKAKMAILNKYD